MQECDFRVKTSKCSRCLENYPTLVNPIRPASELCGKCRRYDYILANPPEIEKVSQEILDYRRERDRVLK